MQIVTWMGYDLTVPDNAIAITMDMTFDGDFLQTAEVWALLANDTTNFALTFGSTETDCIITTINDDVTDVYYLGCLDASYRQDSKQLSPDQILQVIKNGHNTKTAFTLI